VVGDEVGDVARSFDAAADYEGAGSSSCCGCFCQQPTEMTS
jgi:hypothetical protein